MGFVFIGIMGLTLWCVSESLKRLAIVIADTREMKQNYDVMAESLDSMKMRLKELTYELERRPYAD